MKIYRIRNWDQLYENNRSRTVKDLAWVAIPNRHDGEVYSMIMAHPKASEIFTAWILLLQVASRCQPRGSLVRDNGRPHTPQTLAVKTRGKTEWFTIALEFLSSHEIGWIQCEQVPEDENDAAACQDTVSSLSPSCQSGDEEQKGMEGNGNTPIVPKVTQRSPKRQATDSVVTLFEVNGIPDPIQTISEQLVQRLNQLYRRRSSTIWTDKEKQALRKVIQGRPTVDEIDLVCRYSEKHEHHRKDVGTLLNNWNGELDRARAWDPAIPRKSKSIDRLIDEIQKEEQRYA